MSTKCLVLVIPYKRKLFRSAQGLAKWFPIMDIVPITHYGYSVYKKVYRSEVVEGQGESILQYRPKQILNIIENKKYTEMDFFGLQY